MAVLTMNAARTWSPNRMDPTRTGALRRSMLADLRRRFREIKRRVRKLLVEEDALGLEEVHPSFVQNAKDAKGHGSEKRTFAVAISKDYFPKDLHRKNQKIQEFLEEYEVEATSRTEAAHKVWAEHRDRLLPLMIPASRLGRKVSLHVGDLRLGAAGHPGRPTPVLVHDESKPLTSNVRWRFMATSDQLKAFQTWLRKTMATELLGRTEDDLWRKYAEEGFKKGAGRSFDDVRRSQLMRERPELFLPENQDSLRDFYEGSKEEFLRSAFGRPVGIEKIKQLASRTFTDLKGVGEHVATRMSRTLLDGLVQGEHSLAIARSLDEDLDVGLGRAETIARTEISRAYSEGQLDALETMGVEELGVEVEWSTAGDSAVCPLCEPLEGVVVKIEDARGEIPRHPNCRCAWVPANVGEDSKGQIRGKRAARLLVEV